MSKKEVVDFIFDNILFETIKKVKKMYGIHRFKYDEKHNKSSFLLFDSMSHFWNVVITPTSIIIYE